MQVQCPSCGWWSQWSPAKCGKSVACPRCALRFCLSALDSPPLSDSLPEAREELRQDVTCAACGYMASPVAVVSGLAKCPHCGAWSPVNRPADGSAAKVTSPASRLGFLGLSVLVTTFAFLGVRGCWNSSTTASKPVAPAPVRPWVRSYPTNVSPEVLARRAERDARLAREQAEEARETWRKMGSLAGSGAALDKRMGVAAQPSLGKLIEQNRRERGFDEEAFLAGFREGYREEEASYQRARDAMRREGYQ